MRKFSVIAFCIFSVAITVYGFMQPSYHLQQLITLNDNYAVFRIAAALSLAVYLFIPRIRTEFAKKLMKIWGGLLLSFGAITFVSPTFLGSFVNYVPLGDVFISIEGGVLAIFLSLRLPTRKSAFSNNWSAFKRQFTARPQKLLPAVTSSKTA